MLDNRIGGIDTTRENGRKNVNETNYDTVSLQRDPNYILDFNFSW